MSVSANSAPATDLVEVTDENFDATVLGSSQPFLLEFWATWCPPCRRMAPVLAGIAAEYADRLTVGKLDTDVNPRVLRESGVLANPTIQLYRDGQLIMSVTGARSAPKLRSEIEDALSPR